MKKQTIIILTLLAAMSCQQIMAEIGTREFSFHGNGGLSSLQYELSQGVRSNGLGGGFGLGYKINFQSTQQFTSTSRLVHENWGIYTGIELNFFNAEANLSGEKFITKGLDDGQKQGEHSIFDMHTTLTNYSEIQNAMFLSIPIMGAYKLDQFFIMRSFHMYFMGGLKFGIPLNATFKSTDANITNRAYYPSLDNWVNDSENVGAGTFTKKSFEGELELGISTMVSLEIGLYRRNQFW